MSSRLDWHALFAPLPEDAAVVRKPEHAISGWETITVELSAGAAGLRHCMVTLDATGTPISAGDWVLYCSGRPVQYVHENVGGRIQPDGSFLGTRWRTLAVDVPGRDEPETKETVRSDPSAEDVAALMALVRELVKRAS
ncbi:MAG: hypothetical protein K0R40_1982 [Burkholderiales bacterium]|nr:hypothetical protein [Burkholderiales bacterium]